MKPCRGDITCSITLLDLLTFIKKGAGVFNNILHRFNLVGIKEETNASKNMPGGSNLHPKILEQEYYCDQ